MEYFKESVAKDGDVLSRFCDALKNGEETKVEEIFEKYLKKTISIRDTFQNLFLQHVQYASDFQEVH